VIIEILYLEKDGTDLLKGYIRVLISRHLESLDLWVPHFKNWDSVIHGYSQQEHNVEDGTAPT